VPPLKRDSALIKEPDLKEPDLLLGFIESPGENLYYSSDRSPV
jgi:hypothetical protein